MDLHFDFDNQEISIKSGLPLQGRIDFTTRVPASLKVRIPEWADPSSVGLTVQGKAQVPGVSEGFARVPRLGAGQYGSLTFPVPCRRGKETVDGAEYETTWVGNQILQILPRGTVSPLPF